MIGLWAVAVPLAGVAVYAAAAPAQAAPAVDMLYPTATFGPSSATNFGCMTDNTNVTWYMDSNGEFELEAPDRTAVSAAVSRWDNGTDLTYQYDNGPTFSGSGETDIVNQEGAFGQPDNVLGATWCDDPVMTYTCDQQYVRMRGAGVINETVAAHESGHAVGLKRGDKSSPVQGGCNAVRGIMRDDANCLPGPALGDMPKQNVNWVY